MDLSYEGLNRTEEAIAAYRNAIAWQADSAVKNSGPFLNLGSLLADGDRVDEGLTYLLEAARRMSPGLSHSPATGKSVYAAESTGKGAG